MPEVNEKQSVTVSPASPPPAALGKTDDGSQVTRRTFFSWLSIGWIAFIAATGGFFTMMLRFFFPNVLFEPVQTFRAGFPEDYQVRLECIRRDAPQLLQTDMLKKWVYRLCSP
jgi:cytochrome b6-f complex iron-sulfur subunit